MIHHLIGATFSLHITHFLILRQNEYFFYLNNFKFKCKIFRKTSTLIKCLSDFCDCDIVKILLKN